MLTKEAKEIIVEFYKKAKDNIKIETPSNKCECGGTFVKREGKFGVFYGCSNFPKCQKTKKEFELIPYVNRASTQWINDCRMIISNLGKEIPTRKQIVDYINTLGLPSLIDVEDKLKAEIEKLK